MSFPPSSIWSLLRRRTAPQRRRNLAVADSFDPTPTQQSLPYDDVKHPCGVGLRDRVFIYFPSLMVRVPSHHRHRIGQSEAFYFSSRAACSISTGNCPFDESLYFARTLVPLRHRQSRSLHVASPPSVYQWGTLHWRG